MSAATSNLLSLKKLYILAKDAYYNSDSDRMTDAAFDKLEDKIRKLEPEWEGLKKTGAPVRTKKTEIMLPFFLPSLNKVKPGSGGKLLRMQAKLAKYNAKTCVLMAKLDGSSVFGSYVNGKCVMLATRGDGTTGKDISFLIPRLTRLKLKEGSKLTADVRFEAVLSDKVFDKKYASDEAGYTSARALVSGILNRSGDKADDGALADVHFVALRALSYARNPIRLLAGLGVLLVNGLEVVESVKAVAGCSEDFLLKKLAELRVKSKYKMDGLVVHSDTEAVPIDADKPDFAFAFKLDEEIEDAAITTIRKIVWKVSAFGDLIPKAIVDPVDFDGVTVKQCALHNYAWAVEKGAGVGAKVRLIRSGEIIPKIVKVESKAKISPPRVDEFGPYEWDKSKTNLRLVDTKSSADIQARVMTRFFKANGLDAFGPALAQELVSQGVTKTSSVARLQDAASWRKLTGSDKMSARYAEQIRKFRANPDLATVMAASGVFGKGLGATRVNSLLASNPRAFNALTNELVLKLEESLIETAKTTTGCGPAFAETLSKGIKKWYAWHRNSTLVFNQPSVTETKTVRNGKLKGQLVSFTGYRNAEQEQWVSENGGTVVSFGSKTTTLLYSPTGKASGKVKTAQSKGVTCCTFEELQRRAAQ